MVGNGQPTFHSHPVRSPALLSLLLGALAALGFAPLELWPLTLVGLAGWLLLVHAAPTWRAALWRGWLFGLGHFTINNNWFQHAFDFQDVMPPVLGYVAAVALALYLAVYPALAALLAWRARSERPDASFALVAGAAWIATEWLRAVMFTGYAWDPLAVIWVPVQPVAALSAWVGTYALSGITVAAVALLVTLPLRPWPIVAMLLALDGLLVAQGFSYRSPRTDRPRRSAGPCRSAQCRPGSARRDRRRTDSARADRPHRPARPHLAAGGVARRHGPRFHRLRLPALDLWRPLPAPHPRPAPERARAPRPAHRRRHAVAVRRYRGGRRRLQLADRARRARPHRCTL
jgi:hypothetical protein